MIINLLRFISIAVIALSAALIWYFIRHRKDKPKKDEVSISIILIPVGAICAVFFSAISLAASFDKDTHPAVVAGLLLFAIFGLLLELVPFSVRITYDETGFTSRNAFWISRTFKWVDVTGLTVKRGDTWIYIGKKRVLVDGMSTGGREFIKYLRKRYRAAYGVHVPESMTVKDPIYHGNINNPILMTVLFFTPTLILSAITIGFIVTDPSVTREELKSAEPVFCKMKYNADDLVLYVEGEELPYRIREFEKYAQNVDRMVGRINAGESFEVLYDDYSDYNMICEIKTRDGSTYLSLDSANAYLETGQKTTRLGLGAVSAVMIVFDLIMVAAARHPEKFSPKFLRLTWGDQLRR